MHGGDFVSSLNRLTSKIKLPWAKFAGEMHMPGHNFTGPGTRLDLRLDKNDIPHEWSMPINRVDRASYHHDLQYRQYKDTPNRNIADQAMINELNAIDDPTWRERLERAAIIPIMKSKVHFGFGINVHKLLSLMVAAGFKPPSQASQNDILVRGPISALTDYFAHPFLQGYQLLDSRGNLHPRYHSLSLPHYLGSGVTIRPTPQQSSEDLFEAPLTTLSAMRDFVYNSPRTFITNLGKALGQNLRTVGNVSLPVELSQDPNDFVRLKEDANFISGQAGFITASNDNTGASAITDFQFDNTGRISQRTNKTNNSKQSSTGSNQTITVKNVLNLDKLLSGLASTISRLSDSSTLKSTANIPPAPPLTTLNNIPVAPPLTVKGSSSKRYHERAYRDELLNYINLMNTSGKAAADQFTKQKRATDRKKTVDHPKKSTDNTPLDSQQDGRRGLTLNIPPGIPVPQPRLSLLPKNIGTPPPASTTLFDDGTDLMTFDDGPLKRRLNFDNDEGTQLMTFDDGPPQKRRRRLNFDDEDDSDQDQDIDDSGLILDESNLDKTPALVPTKTNRLFREDWWNIVD